MYDRRSSNIRELYAANFFRIVIILLCLYIIMTNSNFDTQIKGVSSQVKLLIDASYRVRTEVKEVSKKMIVFDQRMMDLEKRMIRLELELERVQSAREK